MASGFNLGFASPKVVLAASLLDADFSFSSFELSDIALLLHIYIMTFSTCYFSAEGRSSYLSANSFWEFRVFVRVMDDMGQSFWSPFGNRLQ